MSTKNTAKVEVAQTAEFAKPKRAATKMVEEETAPKIEAVAYIGPDIRNVTVNGTVYANGIPKGLKEKIEEIPAIKSLLIPVSEYAQSGGAVAQRGSALNRIYEAVESMLIEVAEKKEG